MSHPDNQPTLTTLAVTLERVETKLDTLIGTDVNKGRVRMLEDDVKELKKHRDHAAGWLAGAGAIGGFIVAALAGILKWLSSTAHAATHFSR